MKDKIQKIFKKMSWRALRRDEACLVSTLGLFIKKIPKFFKRLPKILREYFFLLVMSAEENVKRFRRIGIKNVPELSEVKVFQKDLRKKTFKTFVTTCAAILLIITIPIIFKNRFAHSMTYNWSQSSWANGLIAPLYTAGQAGVSYASVLTSNLSNWKYYSNIVSATGTTSSAVTANASGVTLTNVPSTPAQENGTTYPYSTVASSSGQGTYQTTSNTVGLRKPFGFSCGVGAECVSGLCSSTCKKNIGDSCSANSDCGSNQCLSSYGNVCGYSYAYTGGQQTLAIPANITSVNADIFGAAGATAASGGGAGGKGGEIKVTLSGLTPGGTMYIYVGGQAGYNGGGAGGSSSGTSSTGAIGGDASDIRINGTASANRVAVAGGGGGGGGGNIYVSEPNGIGGCAGANGSTGGNEAGGTGGLFGTGGGSGTGSGTVGGSNITYGSSGGGGGGGGYNGGTGGGGGSNYGGGGGGGGGTSWTSGGAIISGTGGVSSATIGTPVSCSTTGNGSIVIY